MWLLYQVGVALALVLAGPVLLARRGRHYLATLGGRLGAHSGRTERRGLWVHAVSVGEVGVAATLLGALPAESPLLVTTITPTGQARAKAAFAKRASLAYLPFELGFAVRRFFRRFEPRALVLAEGDLWPLVLRAARRRELPIYVINGRVSDRSFARMRRISRWLGPIFRPVDRWGVQTEADRERLLALGVPAERVVVTGNLKYETREPAPAPELEAHLTEAAAGRPIVVAGSTMAGEEEQVLAAFERAGGGGKALLVIAPRHPERWEEVARLLAARGLAVLRRSRLDDEASPAEAVDRADVVLLDSLGELAATYRQASAAFIGGTLVDTGGHNPLEASRFAVPVAVGPSMHNFREMAQHFDDARAWRRAADAEELGEILGSWLDDPEAARRQGDRGRELIDRNRGALAKTLELLAPILQSTPGEAPRK